MSKDNPVNKDRRDFAQDNSLYRLRCPECVRTKKTLRHCKIFKNLPALWWHIKQIHGDISNLSFNTTDIIKTLNGISKAREWGIFAGPEHFEPIAAITAEVVPTTTSSSLRYRGRLPRKDVYQKLEKIASILQNQSELFPDFKLRHIRAYIGHVLDNPDERTVQNYLNCIIEASEKDKVKGTIDVTHFCAEFKIGV